MRYTVRPISDRTAFTGMHRSSKFKAPWLHTERLLSNEVAHLKGENLVIEADVGESDIRIDGQIKLNARLWSPGIRVAFDSKYGPLTYATDRFWEWQDNVRAIALGLEALRKVDRYGITKRGEQYAGWKQLPPSANGAASHMTRDQARDFLLSLMKDPGSARHLLPLEELHRRARAKTHPDRHAGDQTLWDQVEAAAQVLGVTP